MFRFCAAFTNQHILINPIRANDVSTYTLRRKQIYRDGILRLQKKAERRKQLRQLQIDSLAIAADENDKMDDDAENDYGLLWSFGLNR